MAGSGKSEEVRFTFSPAPSPNFLTPSSSEGGRLVRTRWQRMVFKFKLIAAEGTECSLPLGTVKRERRRIIPTSVKVQVWKRDGGKCVMCGATDELHFDHDLPYSLGHIGQSRKRSTVVREA